MAVDWVYETLPHVRLGMTGKLSVKPDPDFEDDTMRSHFDQYLNWRIDENYDEFVIRIARKPQAPRGHINVDVKIEGGLSTQSDGSVRFDGGNEGGNGISSFALLFEISHESTPEVVEPEEVLEEPEEQEIKFFDHPDHKLHLAPENYYNYAVIDNTSYATCYACRKPIARANARWVYECPNKPDCDYCVHAKCAQMARTIRHPSHLQHSLKLLKLEPGFLRECNVCKAEISCGLHYNCARCDFDLHCECPNPVDEGYSYEDRTRDVAQDGTPAMPQAMPQYMPQAIPQATAQAVPQVVAPQMTTAELQMRLLQQQMENQMQLNIAHQTAINMVRTGWAISDLAG